LGGEAAPHRKVVLIRGIITGGESNIRGSMMTSRLDRVLALIDAANARDPNSEGGEPRELLYGRRMTAWLERVCPESTESLRIAARGQHLRRWEVPRDNYPATREGYLKWRTYLYGFHADHVADLMAETGYGQAEIDRVKALIQKRGIKSDAEVQTLEDVICLVFLENYLADFAATQDPGKLMGIVRKTWKKMSERGHELALQMKFPDAIRALLAEALSERQQ
jgi:hypothetical protein